MEEVTELEFETALATVNKYYEQFKERIDKIKNAKKTTIDEFITKHSGRSTRLCSALRSLERERQICHIEDITKRDFLKTRNAGWKTYDEFCELKELNKNHLG